MKKRVYSLALALLFIAGTLIAETTVTTFSGNGGKNTRPFSVEQGWEIQWDAEGELFQLYLYTSDGQMKGVPANQQGPGEGSSYQPNGGRYYLQVNAMGDWEIDIVQVEDSSGGSGTAGSSSGKDTSVIATFSGNGGKNTRPFSVEQGWEIQWDAEGELFQLYLYTADDQMKGVPANQQGPGEGSSYQPNGGRYYLQVNALGNWEIEIVSLE